MNVFFICGLPRGGTSVVARIVDELGIPMLPAGQESSISTDLAHRYPHGTMEDDLFKGIVWGLSDAKPNPNEAGDHHGRHFLRTYRTYFNSAEKREVVSWLLGRQRSFRGIGVKLPGMMFVLDPLLRLIQDCSLSPRVIFVRRDLDAASKSLADKRGPTYSKDHPLEWAEAVQSMNHWALCMAKTATERLMVPYLDVSFEGLLSRTEDGVRDIADFCEVPFRAEVTKVVNNSLHKAA